MKVDHKNIQRINVPYKTKSGLEIGLRYERPSPDMSRDAELIQSALLGNRSSPSINPAWLFVAAVSCYVLVSCIAGLP
jgi:hypothetical protein